MYTAHHSKYFAHWLTLRARAEESVPRTLAGARVDMNPHQVEAALFALRSPVSAGVLLADEVGLGKTIEAGLVIAQNWAEQRRRILLVVPATLRKQWRQELMDKFGLPSVILEAKSYRELAADGVANPFAREDCLVIASYEFAAARQSDLKAVDWHLVVLDEAHKLRNLYKGAVAKRATALNEALRDRRKVLLTATPFQNSLMELYGLVSFISDEYFGGRESFQMQYASARASDAQLQELKLRLKPICWRTLRRQVQQEGGVNFTRRFSITQDFTPSDEEAALYERVSDYLRDPNILAIKPGARHLVTLVVRKILASSSFAIADTLGAMANRLMAREALTQSVLQSEYETIDELADETEVEADEAPLQGELLGLQAEIAQLTEYRALAERITRNAKGEALVQALERAFAMAQRLGGERKAVIFTESCRTQLYLRDLLNAHGYVDRIVLLNGSNSDADSKKIYEHWRERHAGTAMISGSKSADMKAAIVEEFRDRRDILISTEAGGEGVNLQFCSLLINYDLPWNPQRVEQRIGRVHRYGQKSDVVVVNFVNRRNRADELVFELLARKFELFDGVFGASDEVLGAIESGVNIEQRIHAIYQQCRDVAQIEEQFARLRTELDEQIAARESGARQTLLEHFDADVVSALRLRRGKLTTQLSAFQQQFLRLVQAERPTARVEEDVVTLTEGRFAVTWPLAQHADAQLLHPDEGLGAQLCAQARERPTPDGVLTLDYDRVEMQLSDVKQHRGGEGLLRVTLVAMQSARRLEQLVCSAIDASGEPLPTETAERLLLVPGTFASRPADASPALDAASAAHIDQALNAARRQNEQWFHEETERLDRWAEDQRLLLKRTVDELDAQIKDARRLLRQAVTLEEKVAIEKDVKRIKRQRDEAILRFYEHRQRIADEEDAMLARIEDALKLRHESRTLFTVKWVLR